MTKRKSPDPKLDGLRAELWRTAKDTIRGRLETLQRASELLQSDFLTAESRQEAAGEAHKLAGSLGIFDFPEAAALAKSAEMLLKRESPLAKSEKNQLAKSLNQLKRKLSRKL